MNHLQARRARGSAAFGPCETDDGSRGAVNEEDLDLIIGVSLRVLGR
jgi:hypothetical protein